MKILLLAGLLCLAVSCLASAPGKRPNGPPPRRPSHRNTGDKSGWGWNGEPLHYGKPPACLNIDSIPYNSTRDNAFFHRVRPWYYSFGTAYGLNAYYKVFNGRPATKQSQIDQMCPVVSFGFEPIQNNTGSGVQWGQYCDSMGLHITGVGRCYTTTDPTTYDKGVDLSALVRQEYYLIKTDSKEYAIYYVCNDISKGDLQLLSPRPYVSPDVVKIFLSLLPIFNIKVSEAQAAICSSPDFEHYPPPLENYPDSAGGPNSHGDGWGHNEWQITISTDGWSANNGWTDHSNGWSSSPPSNGWSNNGWGSDNGPSSSGWGWDHQGWSADV